jgi:hypothetical protein
MTEAQIRSALAAVSPLDRELYQAHLETAKASLGIPAVQRSLAAANAALTRMWQGQRWRRENQAAFGWPVLDGDAGADQ